MAQHITLSQAQSWTESTKLTLASLDTDLEAQQSTYVLNRLNAAFDISTWIDAASTPPFVTQIIAMRYIGWLYNRTYSEEEDLNPYGMLLLTESDKLIVGLIDGSVVLPLLPPGVDKDLSGVSYYPSDSSSLMSPTFDDASLGDAKFSMGRVW